MLFASTELVARIERAEARLMGDSAAAIAARRPESDVVRLAIGAGLATYTGPGSPLNKVAGLGFDPRLDEAALEAVEQAFAQRSTPVQVEVATLGDPAVVAALTRRGYLLMGFENVLGRRLDPTETFAPVKEVVVKPSEAADLAAWIDTIVTGFATPDTQGVASHESFPRDVLEQVITDMTSAEGFERWCACRSGELAGAASMRRCDGVAQLTGAATLPEHRRRGVQTALLHARLAHAAERGCDVAVITTQPGSRSMQNAQRQGFELLYARAVLVREA
jgi:ribosomal protein S18 acetylase RimI-like enzyme